MEKTRSKPKELLPYGMLLNRLFKHVVSIFPEIAIDHYISHDRVMHPFAPHYERKTRSDRGKKRPRESNASSSSTTLNHTSSSHPLDDTIDENDDESFHFNPSSPSQNVSSSSNDVSRVCQNPPRESHDLNTYLSETINLQTQQRDAHRERLRSIRQALKNMIAKPSLASSSIQTMLCHVILSFPLFKSSNSHTSLPPLRSSSSSPLSSMSCSNHHSNFSRKPRMSDKVLPSTKDIQPPVIQKSHDPVKPVSSPISLEPSSAQVNNSPPSKEPSKETHLPYPSRVEYENKGKNDKVQIQKLWEMFKKIHVNITLAYALILMPKYQKMLKSLLSNKEKLNEMANTPVSKKCLAIILKKLPEKLEDPG
ncbi:hypothetical protein Tco_0766901 [Tanacetum coccineum]